MHVLVGLGELERAIQSIRLNAPQAGQDLFVLGGVEESDLRQHGDMGYGAFDIVGKEPAIGRRDRVLPQKVARLLVEPPTPERHAASSSVTVPGRPSSANLTED